MALHTQLPIYKVTYDLLALITKLTAAMPRDFKRSLGDDLRRRGRTVNQAMSKTYRK